MKFRLLLTIFFFAITVLIFSCASMKRFKEVPETNLIATNVIQLNGQFQNREETCSFFVCSFWAQLFPFDRDSVANWTKTFIELRVDNKFLDFSLLKDTVVLKTNKFKYKLQNGFVVFKKNKLQGVPLLFYRYQKRKNRITLDKENNIRIYVRGSGEGGILIFIFGSPVIEDYKFLRLK